jgi:hypothetical protein
VAGVGSLRRTKSERRHEDRPDNPELKQACTFFVGPSGTEVNDRPVLELQIQGPAQKLHGMLVGRNERELVWIATMLRQALQNAMQPEGGQSPANNTSLFSDRAEPPSTPVPPFNVDYRGMTIAERLSVARLSESFAAAVKEKDLAAMLDMLRQIQMPQAGAEAYADTVLADAEQGGN